MLSIAGATPFYPYIYLKEALNQIDGAGDIGPTNSMAMSTLLVHGPADEKTTTSLGAFCKRV